MEDNFDQNDFEAFLREQVRNHRMYPADTVWRDINKKLHGDKKWPALTIAAFTLLSATIAICVYFTPQPDLFTIKPANIEIKNSTPNGSQHNIVLDNLTPSASDENSRLAETFKNPGTEKTPTTTSRSVKNNRISKALITTKAISGFGQESSSRNYVASLNNGRATSEESAEIVANSEEPVKYKKVDLQTINSTEVRSEKIKPLAAHQPALVQEYNDKNLVDDFLKDHKDDIALYTTSKPKTLKNKFSFQIYLAPSISYRKLLEDRQVLKEGTHNNGPVGLNYVADVNNVVRHKPGNGLELGVSLMYNVSDKFRVKSGLQFNMRQYSIEAYRSSTELASIALVGNNGIDTINTLAIYRNSNGYYSTELINRYYQIAIPVGVEWEIFGNKTIQFNVAGSIQPTYLINRNAYLISTNFKNYSEHPDLVRSFNINSNIETFISFKAGYFKWQIGPQIRYQPYSTFIPQYPIKEHLLDYGIKLGLSKTFN